MRSSFGKNFLRHRSDPCCYCWLQDFPCQHAGSMITAVLCNNQPLIAALQHVTIYNMQIMTGNNLCLNNMTKHSNYIKCILCEVYTQTQNLRKGWKSTQPYRLRFGIMPFLAACGELRTMRIACQDPTTPP